VTCHVCGVVRGEEFVQRSREFIGVAATEMVGGCHSSGVGIVAQISKIRCGWFENRGFCAGPALGQDWLKARGSTGRQRAGHNQGKAVNNTASSAESKRSV